MKKIRTEDEPAVEAADELQPASEPAPRAPRVELDFEALAKTIGGLTATTKKVIELIESSTSSPGDELLSELETLRKAAAGAHFGFYEAARGEAGYGKTTEVDEAARLSLAVENLVSIATGTHRLEVRGLGPREIPNLESFGLRADAVRVAKAVLLQLGKIEKSVRRTAEQSGMQYAQRMAALERAYRIPVLAHLFAAVEILCRPERPDRNPFALADTKRAIFRAARAHGTPVQINTLHRDLPDFRAWSASRKGGS
ncbi:MAG: hypothetical protein NDJ92_18330 [Thermoanaerobaculia bacterium]|nr:hypothetical protein [Thermoanaerobaculia bacterium]